MHIVLFHNEQYMTRNSLPLKVNGQHKVCYELNGERKQLFYATAVDEKWVLKSVRKMLLMNADTESCVIKKNNLDETQWEIILQENKYYFFNDCENQKKYFIYTEPESPGIATFTHYNVPGSAMITVGYDPENHISYPVVALEKVMKGKKLDIIYEDDGIIKLRNNTGLQAYRNGTSVTRKETANFGDELYIFGLRILLGRNFVTVNDPYENCVVSLQKWKSEPLVMADTEEDSGSESEELFSSAPKDKKRISTYKVTIDSPPHPAEEQNVPWGIMMGPSITMALGSGISAVFSIHNIIQSGGDFMSVIPTGIMALCMIVGTIVWPIFAKRFDKRARDTKQKIAENLYINELNKIEQDLDNELKEQNDFCKESHPELPECIERIKSAKMELWERRPSDDVFLDVIIGNGNIPADIELSHQKYTMSDTPSEAERRFSELMKKELKLKNVPVSVNLRKQKLVGLIGKRDSIVSMTKSILLDLTSMQDYDDLKILFICSEKERQIWKFVRWIPHVWSNDKSVRYFAADYEGANELSKYLMRVLESADDKYNRDETHYLIIAADRSLAEKMKAIREFTDDPERYERVSMLALFDEKKYLPKNCSAIIKIGDSEKNDKVTLDNLVDDPIVIDSPRYYHDDPEKIFADMANIELHSIRRALSLPTELTYFDMLQAGKPEHLDVLSHWKESNPVNSLAAPVGVDADGYLIKLDIHEKMHGPHGLIAGMTGSGKSEFIIAYIASMAINYSPDEVAFVLIDFKGGGMADVFKNLPHIAGTITNLDNNELQRSFIAIESELEKRQKLFKKTSEEKMISNIDIYKYQKLRREVDNSLKPLPHLIIISDEFAELKQQQGDFMDQLIRIARIGRSLGVHLILATQKPEGVVNDQIKSNIKFKVCLKVQDRGDSQSVIGRPDAAWITNPGRFYMQVGADEVFEYGQSPWAGATYHPADQYHPNNFKRIEILNDQGQKIMQASPAALPRPKGTPEKQIDALVAYLRSFADASGVGCEKLWLAPLTPPVQPEVKQHSDSVDAIPFVLNPVIGMYDDLRNQKHCVLTLPMTETGNTIVYGSSGSGKLSFLNQMILSFMERHTPEEVCVYAADFDSGSLTAFTEAPHVAKVLISSEAVMLQDILEQLHGEMTRRKELFRTFGGDYQNYIHNSEEKIPNLVLIIHNYSVFTETCGDEMTESVTRLAREGRKYGIFIVITVLNSNAVKYTTIPLFSNLFVLQQNNTEQYANILGKTGGIYPASYKGRGIFKRGEVTYEFQTTIAYENEPNIYDAISNYCHEQAVKYGKVSTEKMRMSLPDVVDRKYFLEKGYSNIIDRLPVGIDMYSMTPLTLNFSGSTAVMLMFDDHNTAVEKALVKSILELDEIQVVLDPARKTPRGDPRRQTASAVIESCIMEIWELAVSRQMILKNKSASAEEISHYFVFICEYSSLLNVISNETAQYLGAMLKGLDEQYRIHFILTDHAENCSMLKTDDALGKVIPFKCGILTGNNSDAENFFSFEKKFADGCEKNCGLFVSDNTTHKTMFMTEETGGHI